MHFKDLEINNFRGFDHLKIEDFGQINLFVGKNNSGKTSVLEALAFLLTPDNPQIASSINTHIREIAIRDVFDFINFFHNQDSQNNPKIEAKIGNYTKKENIQERALMLSLSDLPTYDLRGYPTTATFIASYYIDKETFELKTIFENGYIPKYESNVKNYSKINSQLIAGEKPFQHLYFYVGKLRETKSISRLVDVLKKIEPRLEDIEVIDGKVLLNLKGMDKLLPINFNGDGIIKIATIIATISWITNGVVHIDEIENGLHYSAHKILWKGIIEASRMSNTQIFATTHSLESIKYLKEALEEEGFQDFQEKVRCFHIEKTKLAGFQTYKYNFESFSEALEYETELR